MSNYNNLNFKCQAKKLISELLKPKIWDTNLLHNLFLIHREIKL